MPIAHNRHHIRRYQFASVDQSRPIAINTQGNSGRIPADRLFDSVGEVVGDRD
ncbi:hypothetical protein QUA13_00825 [Microcoleus sp. S28C3]|uniref:hypothetical protein n=1 Tax=Microcoleus sp. S28C3 TaxID=3055414 RepID=UPI002FD28D80